jgi:hypothetical protein
MVNARPRPRIESRARRRRWCSALQIERSSWDNAEVAAVHATVSFGDRTWLLHEGEELCRRAFAAGAVTLDDLPSDDPGGGIP